MDRKGDLHGHYHGTIPFAIWILIVAVACIAIGLLVPGLEAVAFIGFVLIALWIGGAVILFLMEIDN